MEINNMEHFVSKNLLYNKLNNVIDNDLKFYGNSSPANPIDYPQLVVTSILRGGRKYIGQ